MSKIPQLAVGVYMTLMGCWCGWAVYAICSLTNLHDDGWGIALFSWGFALVAGIFGLWVLLGGIHILRDPAALPENAPTK